MLLNKNYKQNYKEKYINRRRNILIKRPIILFLIIIKSKSINICKIDSQISNEISIINLLRTKYIYNKFH